MAAASILAVMGISTHKPLVALAAAALLACTGAYAQQHSAGNGMRYKWVDGTGVPHFSDGLTPDAIKYGYQVVNDQGLVVRRVQRALSPEERAAEQKLAAEQAAAQRAARDRQRADEQLLAAYPDEAAYKISLQQALTGIDQQIHTSKINLRSQEQALTGLLARAAEFEHNKQAPPKPLQDGIAKQRSVVAEVQGQLLRQQALREQTAKDQAQQLAHYRALLAAQAQQP